MASWQESVEAMSKAPTHQELVACTRAGLTLTEAKRMTRRERHAWIIEFSRQEQEAYDKAKAEAG